MEREPRTRPHQVLPNCTGGTRTESVRARRTGRSRLTASLPLIRRLRCRRGEEGERRAGGRRGERGDSRSRGHSIARLELLRATRLADRPPWSLHRPREPGCRPERRGQVRPATAAGRPSTRVCGHRVLRLSLRAGGRVARAPRWAGRGAAPGRRSVVEVGRGGSAGVGSAAGLGGSNGARRVLAASARSCPGAGVGELMRRVRLPLLLRAPTVSRGLGRLVELRHLYRSPTNRSSACGCRCRLQHPTSEAALARRDRVVATLRARPLSRLRWTSVSASCA